MDSIAGTYFAQAREYAPEMGRFYETDLISGKITVPLTLNKYGYCFGMPMKYVDLNGKSAENALRYLAKLIIGNPVCVYATQQGWFSELFYIAGFFRDSKGVYHTRQDALQQYAGYNDIYDSVFDAATSMDREKYQFSYNDQDYIIWVWKGDYLNLGAGAEMGIYKRAGETEHWLVDHSLEMPMTLKLYNGIDEVFTYAPEEDQWWITGFNPYIQNVDANNLTAIYTIDFTNFKELYEEFIQSDDFLRNKDKWHISEDNKYVLTFSWRGETCEE